MSMLWLKRETEADTFKAAARELECDEDEAAFEVKMGMWRPRRSPLRSPKNRLAAP